jgi:SecD/SecF fusion protein
MMIALIIIVECNSSLAQTGAILFLETYTKAEVTSRLGGDDRLFQLLHAKGTGIQDPILGYCLPDQTVDVQKYLESHALLDQLPGDLKFCWGIQVEDRGWPLYAVKTEDGHYKGPLQSDIDQTEVITGDTEGRHSLLLTFTGKGAAKWAKLTGKNIGKPIAIVINDTVRAAPMVREEIRMGKCMISGNFTREELNELQVRLDPNY